MSLSTALQSSFMELFNAPIIDVGLLTDDYLALQEQMKKQQKVKNGY